MKRMTCALVAMAWVTLALSLAGPCQAADDEYPSRPIRIVAPFPPGGPLDTICRVLAQQLTQQMGQQVVVDNRPGASGIIGVDHVAHARPDGYTLVMTGNSFAIHATLMKKLPYDTIKDLMPVAQVATTPLWIVVTPKLAVTSVRDLVALAKARPGKLTYAGTMGTVTHLSVELFKQAHGIDLVFVPYKGSAPAMTDLISGQVDVMFDTIPSSLGFARSGSLKALAITSAKRVSIAADIPAITEEGLPDIDVVGWYGLLAPAGTDKKIIDRLNAEIRKALEDPGVKARLEGAGADAAYSATDTFTHFINSEIARWKQVVVQAGIPLMD